MASDDHTPKAQNSARIQEIIDSLSLEEKVRMLSGDQDFWPGLKALLKDDYYHNNPFPGAITDNKGLPGIHFIDGPRGVVLFGGATSFPVSMARGASWDIDLEERIGEAIGKELRSFGGTLFGGVCINLLRHPAWGRAQETYGEDPVHLGTMGSALVRGVERHAMACIKHYATNSMENARFKVNVEIGPRTLHEVYLPHFKDCVEAGASVVMSAYNSVNGEWAGQNQSLLRDILKSRWGFKGFVLTDFVFGVRDAKKAIENGLDLEMPYRMVWGNRLLRLIKKGNVSEEQLTEPLTRLIAPQLTLPDTSDYSPEIRGCDDHIALAREAATKSIVMLKNEGDILPLKPDQTIAVVGQLANIPNLGDHGSSDGRPEYVVTPLAGLKATMGDKVTHVETLESDAAKTKVSTADSVIVVVGYTHLDEGEYVAPGALTDFVALFPPPKGLGWMDAHPVTRALWTGLARRLMSGNTKRAEKEAGKEKDAIFGKGGDRTNLSLSDKDEALITETAQLNKKVIVAIMSGSAVMMERWKDQVSGILMIWYPGMEGGHGFADIVLGNASPSGKLPFTIPKDASHLPFFDKDAEQITYDYWHGHRKLARDGHKAAFPFGFGLSYADFEYSKFKVRKKTYKPDAIISVSVSVKNTGSVMAEDVVQLYSAAQHSRVERAPLELKAFQRVSLSPGQSKTVSFALPVSKLAYFDVEEDDFVVEPTHYELSIRHHAEDENPLTATIMVNA